MKFSRGLSFESLSGPKPGLVGQFVRGLFPNTEIQSTIEQICSLEKSLQRATDSQLQEKANELAFLMKGSQRIHCFLPHVYALVRNASQRVLGMRPYDVQMQAAIHLANRRVIEMATGEGKSLTATMPLVFYAMQGRGAHLATSNDYLASRDCEQFRPLFEFLGLKVGAIQSTQNDNQRRNAYCCDITYGTCTEFGFDFLRDRIKRRYNSPGQAALQSHETVTRELFFLLADEADSLLIDEANTPLIISAKGLVDSQRKLERIWAAGESCRFLEKIHYRYDLQDKRVRLNSKGRNQVRQFAGQRPDLRNSNVYDLYEAVETAVLVKRNFQRGKQYVLQNEQILLINENTGRLAEGMRLQNGIQQAVEAEEGLDISVPASHAAKITIQNFVLTYRNYSGMTGTVGCSRSEFKKVYKLASVNIPTHRKCLRKKYKDCYLDTAEQKWEAIIHEVRCEIRKGRSVLVATRTVEDSELLSQKLSQNQIEHSVLNACNHAIEAKIVASAGQPGRVTVSTNMAGRGTDIQLESSVRDAGGLHVILVELNDSSRIDRQVAGRAARQGDPGSFRKFFSSHDKILDLAFGEIKSNQLRHDQCNLGLLVQAQRTLERRRFKNRRAMLYYEKRSLRKLWQTGLDPLVDSVR